MPATRKGVFVGALEKEVQRQRFAADFFEMHAPAQAPGLHEQKMAAAITSGSQPPCTILSALDDQEGQIDQAEEPEHDDGGAAPAIAAWADDGGQEGGDHHHARHRDAVGCGQRIRVPKMSTMSTTPTQRFALMRGT